jgi:hypothetical protein
MAQVSIQLITELVERILFQILSRLRILMLLTVEIAFLEASLRQVVEPVEVEMEALVLQELQVVQVAGLPLT